MTNHANAESVYMDSVAQVQPSAQNNWYDYGSSFSNLMINPQDPHVIFEQDATPEQPLKGKLFHRNAKRVPGVDRNYYCNECGASFSNSSNLKSHGRIHSGERPYVCDVCGASFVQSSNMKAHKRIHTGERPFTCTECGQTFSRSSHLTGHKRTHTGERPYICGVCHESFVTSTHLRNHMRKHTGEKPFVCRVCQSSFAQNGSLQIHLRIHTGERPFKCSNCSSAFRSKADLRSHHKLHTESRPFLCIQCNKTFKTRQYLLKHGKKCGAPPTGKKRGRPKKGASGPAEGFLPTDNSTPIDIIACCPKNKIGRNLGKDIKDYSENVPNEVETHLSLSALKHGIPHHEVQIIEFCSKLEGHHSLYLDDAKCDTPFINHSDNITNISSISCSTEVTQSLSPRDITSVQSSLFR